MVWNYCIIQKITFNVDRWIDRQTVGQTLWWSLTMPIKQVRAFPSTYSMFRAHLYTMNEWVWGGFSKALQGYQPVLGPSTTDGLNCLFYYTHLPMKTG